MALPSPDTLQLFLDVATEAAQAAGAVLKTHWGNLKSIEEKGRPGDLVTEADKNAEAVILATVRRHLPDHPILAEESGVIAGRDTQYCWAIDPLDGTTNYAHGYPVSGVSIGLLIDDVPTVGVVYDPARDRLYRAATGLGATCNRKPIQVSTTPKLQNSLLVTGFAYDRHLTSDNNYAEFCYLTHLTQGVRRGGSASLDLAHVACGELDGYWERGLKPWDIAAGIVLVREAGGIVTAYDQSPLDLSSGRLLATNPAIHAALSEALQATPPLSTWSDVNQMAAISPLS
ncbi:inositol monophosphatase family protein [Spirulina major CS-329]|uniref:inositol monophosphatase family protein n=1 Tax=Spirulina TaxID=1154 RepID=UPI002330EBD6|nr:MULTISPECIES: inositol monophosphatase family protein [Spirulina]MDB9493840.1 inositol monophosphatase family protein [Spirulina subsalsa CS-330]MDB9504691.1 inositol monophosphatase family protein [Spirulina major CS-329]